MNSKKNTILKIVGSVLFVILFVITILLLILPVYSEGMTEFTESRFVDYLGSNPVAALLPICAGTILGGAVAALADNKLAALIGMGASLAVGVFYIYIFIQIIDQFTANNSDIIKNLLPGSFLLIIALVVIIALAAVSSVRLFTDHSKASEDKKN